MKYDYDLICEVEPEFKLRHTFERFLWSMMTVHSRLFGVTIDKVRTSAMVPFVIYFMRLKGRYG